MADIVLTQGQSVPATMQTRYRDMGDGTYARVISFRAGSGGTDIVLSQGQSIPSAMQTRYQDMSDGTHALVLTRG